MTERFSSLPLGCILRPASVSDIWAIRKLVLSAKLDPTQLRWSQFWVIECEQRLVACGQLRCFSEAQELPKSLKVKFGFSKLISRIFPKISVTVMQYKEASANFWKI